MKKMKKLVSFLLAAVMVLTMTTSVFAATVTNSTGHSYDAYQIFSGTQDANDTSGTLGDVAWGTGIKDTEFLAALKADARFEKNGVNVFKDCTDAKSVAEVLSNYKDKSDIANAFANVADNHLTNKKTSIGKDTTSTELAAGYYLLVDTEEIAVGADDAKNSALLQVTNKGNITMEEKYSLPVPDKDITGITHVNGVETKTEFTGAEAVDAEIGDVIEFTLTGTLPENFDDYETYFYAFHDKLSAGLEYVEGSAKVYIDDSEYTDIPSKFAFLIVTDPTGTNLDITCGDLKEVTGVSATSTIKVVYSAKLAGKATLGSAGNPNEMYIEYSNNPNHDGTGKTGNTEKDEAIVFTYELDVTKVDGKNEATKLKDAEFVLLDASGTKVAKVFEGVLTEWLDVPTVDAETGKITWPDGTTLKSDANGKFIIKGLDSGTYYLRETKAPAGYNLLTKDVELVITATITPADGTEGEASLDELKIKVDGTEKDGITTTGIVSATIVNNAGSSLPETGGMGTTLFYAIGAVLVLGAGVLLVAKKRMDRAA